jgi:hypothetical protein
MASGRRRFAAQLKGAALGTVHLIRAENAGAPNLGTEFLCALDVGLAEVARMPERFPVVCPESRRAIRPGGRSASQNDST